MLILSRQPNEKIVLSTSDGPVVIEVVNCNPRQAKIGVTAPPSVTIMRGELAATWRQPRPQQGEKGAK